MVAGGKVCPEETCFFLKDSLSLYFQCSLFSDGGFLVMVVTVGVDPLPLCDGSITAYQGNGHIWQS